MEKWLDHQLLKLEPFEAFECIIEKAEDPFQCFIDHEPFILFVYFKDYLSQRTENLYIEFPENQVPIVFFQNHYHHPLIHDRQFTIQQWFDLKLLIEYIYEVWQQCLP